MTWFQKPMLGVPLDWSNHLNDGLVLHLACNEGHGDVVRDLSMNGNHGTLDGFAFPPTVASGWNPGRTGVGLNFDGTDDYVLVSDHPTLDIIEAITISAWIYPTGWGEDNFGRIVDKNSATGYAFYVRNPAGEEHLSFASSDAGVSKTSDNNVIELNKWQHVLVTYDKANVKFYVDSVYVGGGAEVAGMGTNNESLYIGNRSGNDKAFAGSIDQVRIHNRALTAKEVQDYYINPWQVYLDEDDM